MPFGATTDHIHTDRCMDENDTILNPFLKSCDKAQNMPKCLMKIHKNDKETNILKKSTCTHFSYLAPCIL